MHCQLNVKMCFCADFVIDTCAVESARQYMPIELNLIQLLYLRRYCYSCVSEQTIFKPTVLDKFNFKITYNFQNIKSYVLLCHLSYLVVSVSCFPSYWYSNKYSRSGTCLQWVTRRTYNRRHSSATIPKRLVKILLLCIFLLSDTHSTNQKVAGSIPDDVIGIFHCYNPSDRSMDLGSTQPLTEMSTRSISWGVKTTGA